MKNNNSNTKLESKSKISTASEFKTIGGDAESKEPFLYYFRQLYPKLMALSCRFVDESVAGDMVQDAFVALFEQKNNVRHVPTFLYKSVQNNCLNYIKHDRVVSDYAQRVRIAESRIRVLNERTDENDVFKRIEYQDVRLKVETSLVKLPSRTAEAFRLYYFEELTAKEVAEVMKISYRTVEVHVQKALRLLKEELHGMRFFLIALILL